MRRTLFLIGPLLIAMALATGCSEDAKNTLTPPDGPEYLALDSEDNLAANLELAIEAMDIDGYAALLYDHEPLSSDALDHGAYHYIFDDTYSPPGGPTLPVFFDLAAELACMGHIFSGDPGANVPGVKAIAFELTASDLWHDAGGEEVDGETCPDGTRARAYDTNLLFTLKSAIEGSDNITGWFVQDRLILYCVPVDVAAATEWRLWRWVEVVTLKRTEDATFGQIKALFQ